MSKEYRSALRPGMFCGKVAVVTGGGSGIGRCTAHAACARNLNMFENTRTVRANWLARSLVAPIGVNYHMEHHILASCPWHKLSKAHRMLRDRNVVPMPPSYWGVMQIMTQASSGSVPTSTYNEV